MLDLWPHLPSRGPGPPRDADAHGRPPRSLPRLCRTVRPGARDGGHGRPSRPAPDADSEDASALDAEDLGAEDLAQFADGLAETWLPAGGVPVTRLDKGDWRTVRPHPPLERARCLYCAHTFRDNEYVVVCPCSPAAPACGAAVHRDPAAGLVCWETWRPDGYVPQCPVSSAPLMREPGSP